MYNLPPSRFGSNPFGENNKGEKFINVVFDEYENLYLVTVYFPVENSGESIAIRMIVRDREMGALQRVFNYNKVNYFVEVIDIDEDDLDYLY